MGPLERADVSDDDMKSVKSASRCVLLWLFVSYIYIYANLLECYQSTMSTCCIEEQTFQGDYNC